MPQQDEAEPQPDADTSRPDVAQPLPAEPVAETEPEPAETAEPEPADEATADETEPVSVADVTVADEAEPEPADEATADEAEPAPAPCDAAAEPPGPPAPVKDPRRFSRAERDTLDRQQRRFAGCGRCGYLLADCRVYLGEEALQTAMLASRDDWLRLEGDTTFRRLLSNAYGLELDVDYEYFDGACPECRRRFVLAVPADGPARLKIRI